MGKIRLKDGQDVGINFAVTKVCYSQEFGFPRIQWTERTKILKDMTDFVIFLCNFMACFDANPLMI